MIKNVERVISSEVELNEPPNLLQYDLNLISIKKQIDW